METSIEYRSGVIDTLGRCHFFLNWTTKSGKKRSQAFFGNPEDYGHEKPDKDICLQIVNR